MLLLMMTMMALFGWHQVTGSPWGRSAVGKVFMCGDSFRHFGMLTWCHDKRAVQRTSLVLCERRGHYLPLHNKVLRPRCMKFDSEQHANSRILQRATCKSLECAQRSIYI